jgi:hypothetical protein
VKQGTTYDLKANIWLEIANTENDVNGGQHAISCLVMSSRGWHPLSKPDVKSSSLASINVCVNPVSFHSVHVLWNCWPQWPVWSIWITLHIYFFLTSQLKCVSIHYMMVWIM